MLQDLLLSTISTSLKIDTDVFIRGQQGIYSSNDLINWSHINYPVLPNGDSIRSIKHNNSVYIAVTNQGYIYYSTDKCLTWNLSYKNTNGELLLSAFYCGGKFIVFGASISGTVYSSTTGLPGSWVAGDSFGSSTYMRYCIYENNLFVAVGGPGKIKTSPDGINWTNRSVAFSGDINGLAYGNGKFIAATNSSLIYTSTDGITWIDNSTTTIENVYKATYGLGLFVLVGLGGKIGTSPDGINWMIRNNPIPSNMAIYDITFINNTFIVCSQDGKIVISSDGINWNTVINVCEPYYINAFC